MKREILVPFSLGFGTVLLSFVRGDVDGSSAVKEENGASHTNFSCPIDCCWIYLFLYTFAVAFTAQYIGRVLTIGQKYDRESSTRFAVKLLQTQNQFKFVLLSKLIQNRQDGLKELRNKLKRTESELQSTCVPKYELQKHRLADAILNGYIFPWYDTISDDQEFPICSRQILLSAFTHLSKKVEKVDKTELAKDIILLLHCHWIEYCKAVGKTECDDEKQSIVHNFKAIHPYYQDKIEVAKQYQSLVSVLLKDLLVPELRSDLFCEFLSGILVKGFIFYYANLICNPKWLNSTLISLTSLSQSQSKAFMEITNLQTKAPATPGGEDRPKSACGSAMDSSMQHHQEQSKSITSTQSDSNLVLSAKRNDNGDDGKPAPTLRPVEISSAMQALCKDEHLPSVSNQVSEQPTISSALSGLLSTAAMPLLPDGSTFELSGTDPQEELSTSAYSASDNVSVATNILSQATPHGSQPSAEKASTEEASRAKVNLNNKTRHLSVKDTSKRQQHAAQNHLEKTTHSLDDSRFTTKVGQEDHDASHDSQNEATSDISKSASPMYEEAEDFAATIAKLRSLLEQKQSKTNLTEMDQSASPDEAQTKEFIVDSPENAPSSGDSVKLSQEVLISQGIEGNIAIDASDGTAASQNVLGSIEDDLDENEVELRRIFLNVSITKTETVGADSNTLLFCIQYEGVYVEDAEDDNQRLVLRTTTVKRRFKEFLTLQSQLEENPIWKPHLKHIKTPTKWLSLSFSNQNSTNQRKVSLEKYLQQICYHPILGFSKEVRQFMAYGEDGFQAFEMLTSSSLSFQRLDKLAKTFSGVFHSLKDVLPTFEAESIQPPSSPSAPTATESKEKLSPNDAKSKKMFASLFNFGELITAHKTKHLEVVADAEKANKMPCSQPETDNLPITDHSGDLDELEAVGSELEEKMSSFNADTKTVSDADAILDGSLDDIYPLASVFTQFLCDVLWLPPQRPHVASIAAFMSISGKSLENYLQETLSVLLSEDAVSTCLEWLTCNINGWMMTGSTEYKNDEELPDCTKTDLKNCLRQKIPAWGRWMWGRKRLEATIDRLSGFCQHLELNHDFVLSLVELIFSKVVDTSKEINDNVISCDEN